MCGNWRVMEKKFLCSDIASGEQFREIFSTEEFVGFKAGMKGPKDIFSTTRLLLASTYLLMQNYFIHYIICYYFVVVSS